MKIHRGIALRTGVVVACGVAGFTFAAFAFGGTNASPAKVTEGHRYGDRVQVQAVALVGSDRDGRIHGCEQGQDDRHPPSPGRRRSS